MNLQQGYMRTALKHVHSVQTEELEVRDAYRGLCHEIPALILTNGIELTASFLEQKSGQGTDREKAMSLIHQHIAELLSGNPGEESLSSVVISNDTPMYDTLVLLDALAYYKRFAASYLEKSSNKRSSDRVEEPIAQREPHPGERAT